MSQGKIINYISNVFSKHQEAIATMIVALPGVGLDAIAEYDTAGFSSYLMRDFFYLGVMIVCFLLFKFNLIKKNLPISGCVKNIISYLICMYMTDGG